jgi:hypothetical protein
VSDKATTHTPLPRHLKTAAATLPLGRYHTSLLFVYFILRSRGPDTSASQPQQCSSGILVFLSPLPPCSLLLSLASLLSSLRLLLSLASLLLPCPEYPFDIWAALLAVLSFQLPAMSLCWQRLYLCVGRELSFVLFSHLTSYSAPASRCFTVPMLRFFSTLLPPFSTLPYPILFTLCSRSHSTRWFQPRVAMDSTLLCSNRWLLITSQAMASPRL